MIVTVTNPSSPGASFTKNTNEVILLVDEWIRENRGSIVPFVDFRKALQREKGVNDNNNRNIFPLLKNSGLIYYEKGEYIAVDDFFTQNGEAYVNALKIIKAISSNNLYNEKQKSIVMREAFNIIHELVYESISNILSNRDINYRNNFYDVICFLLRFGKISKHEFALLLNTGNSRNIDDRLDEIEELIEKYRNGLLDISVKVNVRNDISLRQQTNRDNRDEGIGFLTSYGYYLSLLQQADLVVQNNKYYEVNDSKYSKMSDLGGIYE